jgi:hypothetical protein
MAFSDKTLLDTQLVPLRVLSSPKPQYYPFYLDRFDGKPGSGYYVLPTGITSDSPIPGKLRGRKFYLHHPKALIRDLNKISQGSITSAMNYVQIRAEDIKELDEAKIKSSDPLQRAILCVKQNISAAVLPPGGSFTGYLEFESLEDYELGLLLWSISLSDSPLTENLELGHKLGLGKPIGMGSVRISINQILISDPTDGWELSSGPSNKSSSVEGNTPLTPKDAEYYIGAFKTWMILGVDTPDQRAISQFESLLFFKDLKLALQLDLAGDASAQIPISYHDPRDPSYKGYSYFSKERSKRTSGKEETLRSLKDIKANQFQGKL